MQPLPTLILFHPFRSQRHFPTIMPAPPLIGLFLHFLLRADCMPKFANDRGNHHGGSVGSIQRRTRIKKPKVFEKFTPEYMTSPFDVDFRQAASSSASSTPVSIANDGFSHLKKKRMTNTSSAATTSSSGNNNIISSNINKSRLVKRSRNTTTTNMKNLSTMVAAAATT